MSKIAKKLCIVGTGFSGTTAFFHLIKHLTERVKLSGAVEIITVEMRLENGPGLPYAPDELLPDHLCNNQAKVMSLYGNDFVEWMVENRLRLANQYPQLISETHPNIPVTDWVPDPDAFYPRALFGIYLQERFYSTLEKARTHGITVQTINGYSVVDACRTSGKIQISIRNNHHQEKIIGIDKLLLSIGHWVPKDDSVLQETSMYLNSPYPFSRLKAHVEKWLKNKQARVPYVYVKGMGPSGIDSVISLAKFGNFVHSEQGIVVGYEKPRQSKQFHIIAGSRCGFFPAVRGKVVEYKFKFLSEDTFCELERSLDKKLKLDDIIELIDLELRKATDHRLNWKDVVTPNFENAYQKLKYDIQCPEDNDLMHTILLKARRMEFYRFLDDTDKERYDRELDSHFIRVAVPIPKQNAAKLIALFECNVLETIRIGYSEDSQPKFNGTGYEIKLPNHGPCFVNAIIRASGQNFKLNAHPSPLVSSLLKSGEIVENKEGTYTTGGIRMASDESYQVVKFDREIGEYRPSKTIYSYGVLNRYWQNERNFSAAFVDAAIWLAEDWSNFCSGVSETKITLATTFQ
ncbi:MAG: FAD/NAD(P)-binding protein [Vibrio sp.]